MALITVKIPDEGLDVLGMQYEGGREVAVVPARARILVEAGAEVTHDVLGELTGQADRPDAVENNGAMTTADLKGGSVTADMTAGEQPEAEADTEEPEAVEEAEPEAEQGEEPVEEPKAEKKSGKKE